MTKLAYLLPLLLLITACGVDNSMPSVAVIAPLTGDFSEFGEEILAGIEDASKGRVNLIVEDSKCSNVATLSAYRKISDIDNVKYIFGPGCGSPQTIVAEQIAATDQIMMIPNAASGSLFELSNQQAFQIQYSLEMESAYIADMMYQDGHENAVLITYQNDFSTTHGKSFTKNFQGNLLEEISFPDTSSDTSIIIPKLQSLRPDALYATDLSFFIGNGKKKMEEAGIDIPIYGTYAAEMPFIRGLVEGVIYSFPGDIVSDRGSVYSLSYQGAEILIDNILACQDDATCVKQRFLEDERFNDKGVKKRPIESFHIVDGESVKRK